MKRVKHLPGLLKCIFLLPMLVALQVSAKTGSQERITVKLHSADLRTAMDQIEKKSTFRFLCSDQIVSSPYKINIDASDALLTDVLDDLFSQTHLSYKLLDNLIVVSKTNVSVQDIAVTGTVKNATGEPLAGVTVKIKESSTAIATGSNGEYSITVPDGSSLVFSSVGYLSQEVAVAGRTEINVVLQIAAKDINEVVVIGYGTQRRRDLTGSITSVSGNEIMKQPVLTATQAIQGKVAGVQIISSGAPNSAPLVRIRGTGSILAGADPLYVVDGVLTDDIRNLNSSDILSLEVLKDASSAAIYGVRAANGVIIISTKKGRGGKMQVSYDGNVGVREVSHLVKMANASEYAAYINEASVNTGNGAVLVERSSTTTSTDWFDVLLRKALWQNHNLSISGGSDKINYFLSANYLTDEGIVLNNKFKRFTIRSNNEYKLSNKLRVNTLLSYSNGNTQDVNLSSAYNNAYHAAPIIPAKVDGRYGNTSAYQNVGNPVLDIENNDNNYLENRLQGTGYIEYKPVSWLTLRSSYGVELGFNNRRIYTNQFANDTTTFIVTGGAQKNEKSSLGLTEERNSRWVWDNTATFQKSFGRNDFTLLAGITAEKIFNKSNTASRSDVPASSDLWYLSLGDPASQLNGSSAFERTRKSYLSRLNYAFDKKYLLTATIRGDGSSVFNDSYGIFPSVGLGWIITSESFMQSQSIFENLKLRASWGRLGNDNIPTSSRYVTLNTGLPYAFGGSVLSNGITVSGFVDQGVSWETTEEADLGLEFTILKGKLSGEIDVYDKKVKDALIRVPTPANTGTESVITNVASIENKGIELLLNWKANRGKNFSYSISGNASYNKNTVISLNQGQAIFGGSVGSKGNTTYTSNGQSIGSFYILQSEGVFHNQKELAAYRNSRGAAITINGQAPALGDLKYRDVNDDGKIDDNDRIFSGSYQPKFTLGLTINLNYREFDLSINGYGTIGSKIYNGKKAARFNQKDNIEESVATGRWTFTNYSSDIPRANLNALPQSTYFLESGDFARINNLTIGYTFRQTSLERYGISRFRCYLTGQNLATFTKYSGFSPEILNADRLGQGIELNAYPTTRTYAFGVNLTF